MKHQSIIASLLLALTFLIVGCGSNSATPPPTPPPPPPISPTGQKPTTGNPAGIPGQPVFNPGTGGPGVGGPGMGGPGQVAGNLPPGGTGNDYCDGEWCYEYFTDNTPGTGVGTPTLPNPGTGNGNNGGYPNPGTGYNPDYCNDDYGCGDGNGDGYYSDYYGGDQGQGGNYTGQWGNGWNNNDGWYYYGDNFYQGTGSRALQRARTTSSGTSSKLKIRARARR